MLLGTVYATVSVALWGRTLGKLFLRCKVVRVDTGGPTGWWYAAIRALVVSLAWAIPYLALAAAMVVYGYALVDPRQQGLHDKAAGTLVITTQPAAAPADPPSPELRGEGAQPFHSMTTTTSPAPTVSPAVTLISFTVPDLSAWIWFSIFIASSTTTGWPASTAWPTSTSTFTIVPCIGTATSPDPPPAAVAVDAERVGLRAAAAGCARRRRAACRAPTA